jgi:Zn finger protein HypA/HybF involved in hydrogenase expression
MAKATELLIRNLVLEDTCPKCDKATGTDWGGFEFEYDRVSAEETLNAGFHCPTCGLSWERDMTIKFEFGERRDLEQGEADAACPQCEATLEDGWCPLCNWEKRDD